HWEPRLVSAGEGASLDAQGDDAARLQASGDARVPDRPGGHLEIGGPGPGEAGRIERVPLDRDPHAAELPRNPRVARFQSIGVEPARPGRGQATDPLERGYLERGDDGSLEVRAATRCQDLDDGPPQIRLELDIKKRPARYPLQYGRQGRNTVDRELGGGQLGHQRSHALDPLQGCVVEHDRDAVEGRLDVELEAVTTRDLHRREQPGQAVLGMHPMVAPVGQAQRPWSRDGRHPGPPTCRRALSPKWSLGYRPPSSAAGRSKTRRADSARTSPRSQM